MCNSNDKLGFSTVKTVQSLFSNYTEITVVSPITYGRNVVLAMLVKKTLEHMPLLIELMIFSHMVW